MQLTRGSPPGWGLTFPHHNRSSMFRKVTQGLGPGRSFWKDLSNEKIKIRNALRIPLRKSKEKRPLRGPKSTMKKNIKIDLKKTRREGRTGFIWLQR
jgi:hypothetical protein